MRRIAVITGTRAEYGLLYWIIKQIHEDPELELQLIVTGMHLSHEFGFTVKEIERNGFPIAERVEMLLSSDTEEGITISMGVAMIGFAKAYTRLSPDVIVVLGDRFEIYAAVSATLPFRIPVAHLHGGEATEGQIDESIRHAITKMSHIHFAATKKYENRIIQMGELPEHVFCFGALGVDNVFKLSLLSREELARELELPMEEKYGVVTFHPVTLEKGTAQAHISELLEALKEFPDIFWVLTLPNADVGERVIVEKMEAFIKESTERGKIFSSLGQLRYLSLMSHAVAMVGNSSSGIVESPSFKLPVVNIGERQRGRLRSENILDVPVCTKNNIVQAINKALSADFTFTIKEMKSQYGEGCASEKIVDTLKDISLEEDLLKKKFYELKQ